MAVTLMDLSQIETDLLRKSVIDTFLMESNLLELVPWETIGQLSTTVVKISELPSVGFRKINAAYSESTGKFSQTSETISLLGGDIDTDKALARAKNTIADARAIMQTLMLKSIAYKFNDKFINGNPASDPEEFKGIKRRIDDIAVEYPTQKIQATDVDTGINYDTASRHKFLNDLDKVIYSIKGHKPDVLLMNQKTLLAMRALLRQEKLLDSTRDMFDRQIDMYAGARLIDIGVKEDQITDIITSTETTAGVADGTGECTSIYAVKFGIGELTWGIQEYPIEVEDLGQLQTAPKYRTRVDWPLGLATIDPRSVCRLYGVVPDSSA